MIKPNLFIVGTPKTGTTSLHNYLNQHPDIFMSEEKEPWFFATDLYEESCSFHKKASKRFKFHREKDYLTLFCKAKKEKVIGESSVIYIYSKVAAKKIYEFNPHAKIIISIREPVDYLYSSHSQLLIMASEDIEDFKLALEAENSRRQGHNIPLTVDYPSKLFYSDEIKYHQHIKRFINCFSKESLKIVIFEDVIKNIEKAYQDILVFLGVDSNFVPSFKVHNPNEKPRNYTINKIILDSNIKKFIKDVIPLPMHNIFKSLQNKVLLKKIPREPLDATFRKELMYQFKGEVEKTSDLIGIDLVKKWGYDKI